MILFHKKYHEEDSCNATNDFIDEEVELISNTKIFSSIFTNNTDYAKTKKPYLGFRKDDSEVFFERKGYSYNKGKGMFYFLLKKKVNGVSLVGALKIKLFFVNTAIVSLIIFPLLAFEHIFHLDRIAEQERLLIAGVAFIFFTILLPFALGIYEFYNINARIKIYLKEKS